MTQSMGIAGASYGGYAVNWIIGHGNRFKAAVSHDGRISIAEAELLRTICGALHCPLPPMLERG